MLIEGSVRVQLTAASGRQVTLYRIEPGGSCILTTSCILSHEHYPAEAIAETGVDYISTGALTKDLAAIDLSMRFSTKG